MLWIQHRKKQKDGPAEARPSVLVRTALRNAQGVIFICWVELTGDQMRWVFVSDDLTRYRGPVYRGEDTLPAIANLVAQWWDIKKRLGQAD